MTERPESAEFGPSDSELEIEPAALDLTGDDVVIDLAVLTHNLREAVAHRASLIPQSLIDFLA